MFGFIKGALFHATPTQVIIEVTGIGYEICIPVSTFSLLPPIGKEVLLYTSFVVRENSQALYGFLAQEEKELFEKLNTISGIGPKTALSLIGHLPFDDFKEAIRQENIAALCKAPGIGKKTAERLLIDMRDKSFTKGEQHFKNHKNETLRDAMSALITLGYNQQNAEKALKKSLENLPEEIPLGTLITTALKHV